MRKIVKELGIRIKVIKKKFRKKGVKFSKVWIKRARKVYMFKEIKLVI